MTDQILLRRKDLARILGLNPITIKRWEAKGLPVIVINATTKYYDMNQVRAWMEKQDEENK